MLNLEEKLMVCENMDLIGAVMRKYNYYGHVNNTIGSEDIYQHGCIGLMKAVETYDGSSGSAFSSYAFVVIRNEIRKLFRSCEKHTKPTIMSLDIEIETDKNSGTKSKLVELIADSDSDIEDFLSSQLELELDKNIQHSIKNKFAKATSDKLLLLYNIRIDSYNSNRKISQMYLSELLGVSQAHVSRLQTKLNDLVMREYNKLR